MAEPIYIFTDGFLRRKDNSLVLETQEGNRHIPVENVSEIKVFSEVDLNKRLLEFLTEKNICVHFFNHYGYYVGTYYPREFLNSGLVVLKQAEFYLDHRKRMFIARKLVESSIKNMIGILKNYDKEALSETVNDLSKHLESAEKCDTVEQLMAIEGNAKEVYYHSFDKIIKVEEFQFERRSRRPPENELNALISFGNSLLYTTVLSEIYKTHLDPRIGYLHSTNNRRFTLNLDIAEIFKPIIVDKLIFTLIKRKQIKAKDFHESVEGIVLKDSAKKLFIQSFEEKLKETVYSKSLKRQVSRRTLIRMEAYKLEKHILEDESYEPYVE
ncbi:MAG: type I-B CRISPR-associated endonuclease Cas1b [Pseudothermotoga sp.]|uniref:type I-B CRISPR-associated endonuclease Cas1b n=1 Tax=Pseudothermotoga sp. TaxID=2033661 RepID=UPI00258FC1CE|nr:type I-B CRISPR-associated endonuclease Cas1b [Pseudothermotoga sp.]MDI6863703.1 type I-B CRISPR-associated endonuclease Cas1b [Pseudothermotoga sp.]